jgi:hypothetical protein
MDGRVIDARGLDYLLVGGTVVVDEGKIAPGAFPGRPIIGPGKSGVAAAR